MKILIADAFSDAARAELASRGHYCEYVPETTADDLATRIRGFDALIVRSTKVTAASLHAADTLRLVIRAGSGTNTIDVGTAGERGIYVCNVPGRNAIAVAELAFGLLLAIDRHIADNVADLRAGRWDKKHHADARGIHGRAVGIVGLGQVGLAFAERAAAFGAAVYTVAKAHRDEHTLARARASGVRFVDDLTTLARTCDVLSLHAPSTEATRHLIDRDLLAEMRPGTIVLNTARGELVDEAALIEAMNDKDIRAGLDVFADEPASSTGEIASPLAKHPNVYGTHHIGASTQQAQQAVATEAVRIVEEFDAGTVEHCVNRDAAKQHRLAPLHAGGAG